MSYALYEVKVMFFLKNSEGKYLFMNNTQKDSIIYGYVNPLAGHIEPGETIEETVIREVAEETGINKVENIKLRGVVNVLGFKDNPVLLFITEAFVPDNENPTKKDEGEPIWVDLDNLKGYKVFEDVEKLADAMKQTSDNAIFHATTRFENKKLIDFRLSK